MAKRSRTAPAKTTPALPRTGVSCYGCYAAVLNDCSPHLSREHYVTKSLLDYLNKDGSLLVSGFPWMNGQTKNLPPDALAAKVLCERHNSALSPLDDIAVRLFQAFDERGVVGSGRLVLRVFSGHDLERWLLKVLCGLAQKKNLQTDDVCDMSIQRHWLEILFGYSDFPKDIGLYVCVTKGHLMQSDFDLTIRALTRRHILTGIVLTVYGYEIVLSMLGFPNRRSNGRQFAYRPEELYAIGRKFEKSIILSWAGAADRGVITFDLGRVPK
jgi:hypothetical protein